MKPLNATKEVNDTLREIWSKVRLFVRNRRAFSRAVIYPTILFAAYLFLVSADRWVSESKVTVKSASVAEAQSGGVQNLLSGGGAMREDMMFLREFILSQDMFDHLNKALALRDKYAKGGIDLFAGLDKDASNEDAMVYYRRRVVVDYDDISGVLTVAAQGFSPVDAKKINDVILAKSEEFLNSISQRIAKEQVASLDRQLAASAERMTKARNAVIAFQVNSGLPDGEGREPAGVRVVAKDLIKAAQLRDLKTEADLALEMHRANLVSMEKSKMDMGKKFKSLVVISAPHIPQEPTMPRRAYWLGLFFVAAVFAYAIVSLMWMSVRDHNA